jgi:hypothetical protein
MMIRIKSNDLYSNTWISISQPWLLYVLWRVYPLLGNDSVNTHQTIEGLFSMWYAPWPLLCNCAVNTSKTIRDSRGCVFRGVCAKWCEESRFGTPACQDMSLGAKELNWVDKNGKKGIRRCKVDFMCDSKWQTVINPLPGYGWRQNPNKCATVNCVDQR